MCPRSLLESGLRINTLLWVGAGGWKQDWSEEVLNCNFFAYRPQPIPRVALELEWLFKDVLNGDKKAGPLDFSMIGCRLPAKNGNYLR